LLISWDSKTRDEATAAGRRQYPQNGLWSEKIVELRPIGKDSAVVVWEWKLWDHLVQDNDATKANYGAVSARPERLDVNFLNKTTVATDWIHFNGLAYNADLDQIIISSRELSEVYIIDHSTTVAEAASTRGGRQGKGGDFLWRWGNPQAYKRGNETDRRLYGQHNPQWIAKGSPGAGNVLIFNNGDSRPDGTYSSIEEVQTPVNTSGGYTAPTSTSASFAPTNAVWTYKATPATSFFANRISGVQRLQNGNTLICEGTRGNFFEVAPTGTIVWQYRNPVGTSGPTAQGSAVMGQNMFRCLRYAPSYAAFTGRTLTPGVAVELNPTASSCAVTTSVKETYEIGNMQAEKLSVSPNPAHDLVIVNFTLSQQQHVSLKVFNVLGQEIAIILDETLPAGKHEKPLDIRQWSLANQALFLQLKTDNQKLQTIPLQVIR
jgi:Arylsulfotransferase (ASST)